MDETCGENDPNFPLYDPLHKLYHHFWQYHAATPPGHGPDVGHAFSEDLVYWSHLPVAVWNDQKYDNMAIFTGSATIVKGVPTMVYPGLCNKNDWPNCETGTLLAVAVPSDHANDPTLSNWTKPSYNPIVENTQRDPSTAWQTSTGEWRLTNYEGTIFSSQDFEKWSRAADGLKLFPQTECPDFFPVPPPCSGNGCDKPPPGSAPAPTHVHKQSSGGEDWYTFGSYSEGNPGTSGSWTPTSTAPFLQGLDASARLSLRTFYASKSFYDPVKNRRIYWGWARVGPASVQTLPRITTYHAALQLLLFSPLPELVALRLSPPLFNSSTVTIPSGKSSSIDISADWPGGAGNTSEIVLSYTLPSTPSDFGFVLWPNTGPTGGGGISLMIIFDPISFTANVSFSHLDAALHTGNSSYLPGVDLMGDDYNVTNVDYTDPHICQAQCNSEARCAAFTYVIRPPEKGSCCLKSKVPTARINRSACTSGVKDSPPAPPSVALPLFEGDASIDIQIFIDNTVVRCRPPPHPPCFFFSSTKQS